MKHLYLLRHAKSSWDDHSLPDFDRPLNARGKRAAPFMGRLMTERGLLPDAVISSPAKRAASTAELVTQAGGWARSIALEQRIYEASPQTLVNVISELSPYVGSALIVGHNPGMEGLVRYLTGRLEPMPTAALAVIDLQIDSWDATSDGCGLLKALFRPREEMA